MLENVRVILSGKPFQWNNKWYPLAGRSSQSKFKWGRTSEEINQLLLSETLRRQGTSSSLPQVMDYRMFGARPAIA